MVLSNNDGADRMLQVVTAANQQLGHVLQTFTTHLDDLRNEVQARLREAHHQQDAFSHTLNDYAQLIRQLRHQIARKDREIRQLQEHHTELAQSVLRLNELLAQHMQRYPLDHRNANIDMKGHMGAPCLGIAPGDMPNASPCSHYKDECPFGYSYHIDGHSPRIDFPALPLD
ncbi:unnamed protein product [Aphanomyces euteiches]|uniref:Uncharacterized protein n=1 Tax=Aphanomyces euteiches TaxID=100861 RepID=A0A6G0WV20_9STRA|nr:hypothetical protein Ae201684_011278 [Aphanomyces euteiches]KAH9100597.1 hypothetical protein Ae201684P_006793 [Aphanomyces euteiches]KAH9135445.1 hypothetical protein AeRB84_019151 [Aphanomyces euteiches]